MTVLGANFAGGKLWLCLADEVAALPTNPGHLELRKGEQAEYAMTRFRDECGHALSSLAPEAVVILDMETSSGRFAPKTAALRDRFAAETLLAVTAVEAGIACTRIARRTVRSRLGLPASKALVEHVPLVFPEPVGTYWSNGRRDLAALAARVVVVGG